jgi:hypothetical protein
VLCFGGFNKKKRINVVNLVAEDFQQTGPLLLILQPRAESLINSREIRVIQSNTAGGFSPSFFRDAAVGIATGYGQDG